MTVQVVTLEGKITRTILHSTCIKDLDTRFLVWAEEHITQVPKCGYRINVIVE